MSSCFPLQSKSKHTFVRPPGHPRPVGPPAETEGSPLSGEVARIPLMNLLCFSLPLESRVIVDGLLKSLCRQGQVNEEMKNCPYRGITWTGGPDSLFLSWVSVLRLWAATKTCMPHAADSLVSSLRCLPMTYRCLRFPAFCYGGCSRNCMQCLLAISTLQSLGPV